MAEKILNTRIQLKYDTYSNWTTKNPVLKAGEMAIATISTTYAQENGTQEVNSITAPQVLIKVGDGSSNYNSLPFASAKAADVYSWAKADKKPTYAATEITGIGDYIAQYVDETLGISVDTDTQYRITKVDDYNYKLQSKAKGEADTAFADVGTIVIPKYDDTKVKEDISDLKELVGTTAVATQITNAIAALNLATTYEAKGEAAKVQTALNDYQTSNDKVITDIKNGTSIDSFKDVEDAIDGLTASDIKYEGANGELTVQEAITLLGHPVQKVTATDASIVIGGTTARPTVGVQVSKDTDNALTLEDDGLKVVVPDAPEYTIVKDATAGEGYAATYHLTKDGTNVGAAINIPKDMVVESGTVETKTTSGAWGGAGTYIVLTLANATSDTLYIPVDSLIEYVTSGSSAGDMVVVAVSADHKVTATITDGTITKAKLASAVQNELNKAHEHDNKTVLDGIDADKVAAWDKVSEKANDADLAAIAKTGSTDDLVQGTQTLIFNCGDSTNCGA